MKMFKLLVLDGGVFGIAWLTLLTLLSFLVSDIPVYLMAALVGIFMCVVGPNRKQYLHLGLGSALWRRHRLISLWLCALAFATAALVGGMFTEPVWIVVAAPLVIALIRSMGTSRGDESRQRRYGSMKGVHLRFWRDIWIGNITAVVCVSVVSAWRGDGFDLIPVISFTTFLFMALALGGGGVLRTSLRQWVSLGGIRKEWFTKAVWLATANLLGITILYVLMMSVPVAGGTQLVIASLFLPLIVLTMNLAGRRTAWLPVLGSITGFIVCAPIGWLYLPVAAVGLLVMLWGVRKTVLEAEIFNPGFAGWLGITEKAV